MATITEEFGEENHKGMSGQLLVIFSGDNELQYVHRRIYQLFHTANKGEGVDF